MRCYGRIKLFLLFIKAAKLISLALIFMPLSGCATATGVLYNSFLRSLAYAPEMEDKLFNYSIMAFAFIETFALIIGGMAFVIITF